MAKKDNKLVQLSKVFSEMADDLREEGLQKYLELPNGIPSHDTLERVVSILKPDELQDLLVGTLKSIIVRATRENGVPLYRNDELGIEIEDVVAIDGKETRNSGRRNAPDESDRRDLNELNVQSTEFGITLSSTRIDEKTNEIPEAQKILKNLELKGCVVTADALNTQKETARAIVKDEHADYCLAVKANQKGACDEISEYFRITEELEELKGLGHNYRKEEEILSSKCVTREYYISDRIEWFSDRKL